LALFSEFGTGALASLTLGELAAVDALGEGVGVLVEYAVEAEPSPADSPGP